MWWVILCLLVTWASIFALMLVTSAAIVLSWVPRAGVRRWILIAGALLFAFASAISCVAVYFNLEIIEDVLDPIGNGLGSLPRLTGLIVLPIVAFLLSLAVLTVWGARPQPGVPYQPRAAAWSLRRQNRRLWLVGIAAVAARGARL